MRPHASPKVQQGNKEKIIRIRFSNQLIHGENTDDCYLLCASVCNWDWKQVLPSLLVLLLLLFSFSSHILFSLLFLPTNFRVAFSSRR